MKVTPDQVKNLLNNAYGFVSEYGTLYHYHVEGDEEPNTFWLMDNRNGDTVFIGSFDNADICNGAISFYIPGTEDFQTFTILVVATDGSNLLPQLLGE